MNPGMLGFGRFAHAGLGNNLPTPWVALFALGAAILLVLYIKEKAARSRAEAGFASAKAELLELQSQARKHEYRIERFELLWFPTVSACPQDRTILGVAPGLPHCRACMLPLLLERAQWSCRQCGAKHPETLGDLLVVDSISRQALEWFQQRHPGYRPLKA